MSIPFECLYDKSEQATVAGYFLYITFRIDCPTTSNCGAHCWEQAGEEWIMPGESKLAARESGESAGVEGALHHVPAIALRFCLWKARVCSSVPESRESSRKRESLHQFHKSCSPSGAGSTASPTSPVQPVEVCRVGTARACGCGL